MILLEILAPCKFPEKNPCIPKFSTISLYYTIVYYIILYYTILYYIPLYYTILPYNILYSMEAVLRTRDSARRCSVAVRVSDICVSFTSDIDNSPENDLSYFLF